MESRVEAQKVSPEAYQAMLALEMFVRKSSKLAPSLIERVKMRASQINGCAYYIDMYSKDARAAGESEQRLYALSAWRETPFFTAREQARINGWNRLSIAFRTVPGGYQPAAAIAQGANQ